MFPFLFMAFVAFASAIEYEHAFFPQNATKKLHELKKFGTWIQECNGNPNKTLLHFPIEKVPSVCDSLEPLGFSETTPGDCSRIPLDCHQTQEKIQWTNRRTMDHFAVHLDSGFVEVKTTLSENGSFTLKFGSRVLIRIRNDLYGGRRCPYPNQPSGPCEITELFTYLKTKAALYRYTPFLSFWNYTLTSFTRLKLASNGGQVMEIIQDKASSSLTKMNLSQGESVARHPNELDNLHRISEQLKSNNIWSCNFLNNCQEHSIPPSGQLNITNIVIPKTGIYFHIHLESDLNLTIILDNGQSHLIPFEEKRGYLYIRSTGFGTIADLIKLAKPPVELVLVALQQSVMITLPNSWNSGLTYELIIDDLILEHIQSFQIQPNDNQTNPKVLILSPVEPKPSNLDPKSELLSLLLLVFVPLIAMILICLLVGVNVVYLLKRRKRRRSDVRKRRRSDVTVRQQDMRISTNSGYEEIRCDSQFITGGDRNNREYHYTTSNVDYYTT